MESPIIHEILLSLKQLMSECGNDMKIQFGFPLLISLKLRNVIGIRLPFELLVTCTTLDIKLDLKSEGGESVPEGLLGFLNEELKEDLEQGKIGQLLKATKLYFSKNQTSPPPECRVDTTSSTCSSIRNKIYDFSSHYCAIFEEKEIIGKGGYGCVYMCKHKLDDTIYAVKKILFKDDDYDQTIREVKTLSKLQHQNVVRYYGSWIEDGVDARDLDSVESDSLGESGSPLTPDKTLHISFEYCPGSLVERIESRLDQTTAWRYFREILEGLLCIHQSGLIHRDLSKQNIFLDSKGKIKIGDFGFAIAFDATEDSDSTIVTSGHVGNPMYHAPEMRETPVRINQKADMFSIGLILYEMTHHMATQSERVDTFTRFRNGTFDWGQLDPKFAKYLQLLVAKDSSERLSARDIIPIELPFAGGNF